jgi:NAD(P)-dependent dehydrogenase (short-subunit alcohol dehydrogenase family)
MNPVLLVTGTSSGIGLATAVAGARAGFRTVATVRNPDKADALRAAASEAEIDLDVQRLDVTDPASPDACIEQVIADHGRLDAVVNNAGAAHVSTLEIDDMDAVRATMEVNFFGVLAVSRAALPHLRATGGRLVTVTSVGGVIGQPFNEAYCAAKFAVEGYMESLAPVAARVGVTVAVVEPGAVASSFVANAGLDPEAMIAAAGPYAQALASYVAWVTEQFATGAQSAQDAAACVLDVLTAEHPAFRTQTSDAARAFVAPKLADLDGSAVLGQTAAWVG